MDLEALAEDLKLLQNSEDHESLSEDSGCRAFVVNNEIMLDVPSRKVKNPEEFARSLERELGASVTHLHKLHADRHGTVSEMLGGYSQQDTQVFSINV